MTTKIQRKIRLEPIEEDETFYRLAERLQDYAGQYGIDILEDVAQNSVRYLLSMLQVNEVINLTSIRNPDDGIVLHLLDSLLFYQGDLFSEGRFLDIGTGGGFPGVPLHLVSGCPGVLLDSTKKKITAVESILGMLHIHGLTCEQGRVEEFALHQRESFQTVVVRAVAPLPVLVEYASPCLYKGGSLIVSKGVPSDEELSRGEKAASLCGLTLTSTRSLTLPDEYGSRLMLTFQKVSEPSIRLPRAVGLATKTPLA